jgi:hypothetical protein
MGVDEVEYLTRHGGGVMADIVRYAALTLVSCLEHPGFETRGCVKYKSLSLSFIRFR